MENKLILQFYLKTGKAMKTMSLVLEISYCDPQEVLVHSFLFLPVGELNYICEIEMRNEKCNRDFNFSHAT